MWADPHPDDAVKFVTDIEGVKGGLEEWEGQTDTHWNLTNSILDKAYALMRQRALGRQGHTGNTSRTEFRDMPPISPREHFLILQSLCDPSLSNSSIPSGEPGLLGEGGGGGGLGGGGYGEGGNVTVKDSAFGVLKDSPFGVLVPTSLTEPRPPYVWNKHLDPRRSSAGGGRVGSRPTWPFIGADYSLGTGAAGVRGEGEGGQGRGEGGGVHETEIEWGHGGVVAHVQRWQVVDVMEECAEFYRDAKGDLFMAALFFQVCTLAQKHTHTHTHTNTHTNTHTHLHTQTPAHPAPHTHIGGR